MSHNISIVNGSAEAVYVGGQAWHGLGQVLPASARLDREQILALSNTGWQVRETPNTYMATTDNGEVVFNTPGNRNLFRSDTGGHLHTASRTYEVHQHTDVLDAAILAMEKAGEHGQDFWCESAFALCGGRQIAYCFRVGGQILESVDPHTPYLIATTSHDEKWSSTWQLAYRRVECNNMLRAALMAKTPKLTVRHSGPMTGRVADIVEAIGLTPAGNDAYAAVVQRMIETEVTAAAFDDLMRHNFPIKEQTEKADGKLTRRSPNVRRADEVRSIYSNDKRVGPFAGTAWGYVQAVNTWEQHVYGDKIGTARAENTFIKAVDGTETFTNLALALVARRYPKLELVSA